ncbi:polyisoprenoid-binding protein YceI [Kineococcus xinjiangensis]|uniref:Polyisoprenoid-binding protein YceI n=1 Tax=Kineococcus xinjiangensis TaxID=512762 RepID=A0A2S6IJF3_9ACTN|nr:YceI family protein [Kineococcus xinjiangensis]PPK94290.1 polyisoprenoid-binding protein YceI [Kineococcus xinjiangensis]
MSWFRAKSDTATDAPTLPTQQALPAIPGYQAGTWVIDAAHSEVSFTVRHMAVSKVRGRFGEVSGEIVTSEDPRESSVTATIAMASVTTFNEARDAHLRNADFFEVEAHPTMTYRSRTLRFDGEDFALDGELTLKGVTRPVSLRLEVSGFGPDAYGGTRAGFSATGQINRRDFGVDFDARLETGGLVVSDKVDLQLDIEAVLQA